MSILIGRLHRYPFLLPICALLSQCHPYAGTQNLREEVAIGYTEVTAPEAKAAFAVPAGALIKFVVGYIVEEAGKEIVKRHQADYSKQGARLGALKQFPNFPRSSLLVFLLLVEDPTGNYPAIARLDDFLSNTAGTAGATLLNQIEASLPSATAGDVQSAVRSALGSTKPSNRRIALLAVCPVEVVDPGGSWKSARKVYEVDLNGFYFPLLKSDRLRGEENNLVDRFAKSSETLTLEVYGPAGSNYTTGRIMIPLVWSPPKKGEAADWITGAELENELQSSNNKDIRKLYSLMFKATPLQRLTARRAFTEPPRDLDELLLVDGSVSERTGAVDWIKWINGKAKSKAEEWTGAIGGSE